MSKQQLEVERNLRLLFPNLKTEVTIDKIIPSKTNSGIRVDIWIPDKNLIVEVNGLQHSKPSMFAGSDSVSMKQKFCDQLSRDSRLLEICQQYNINYEQIDYRDSASFSCLFRQFSKYLEEQ